MFWVGHSGLSLNLNGLFHPDNLAIRQKTLKILRLAGKELAGSSLRSRIPVCCARRGKFRLVSGNVTG